MAPSTGIRPPKPRLSLRFGITGHRPNRLPGEHMENMKQELHGLFRSAAESVDAIHVSNRDIFADGAPSLKIVSPLAEGADRLAAHAAMECGYELQAILPFARQDYGRDFHSLESQTEFADLLARASAVFEVPRARTDAIADSFAYEAAGLQMLKTCDVLIAIWDGGLSRGRGGSADMVRAALDLGRPVIWLDTRGPSPAKLIQRGTRLSLQEGPPEAIVLALGHLEAVLKQLLLGPVGVPYHAARDDEEPRARLAWFLDETEKTYNFGWAYPFLLLFMGVRTVRATDVRNPPLPASADADWKAILSALKERNASAASNLENVVLARYLWADRLANYYAQLYRSSYVRNFCFAAVAVIAAVCGFLFPLAKFYLVVLEFLLIAAIVLPTYTGRRRKWHERWIDYRHLAELLRPMRVLYLLGTELGSPAPQHHEIGEIDSHWFGWYYRACARELGLAGVACDAAYLSGTRALFRKAEVNGQMDYHAANAVRMRLLEERLDGVGVALFWSTATICVLYIVGVLLFLGLTPPEPTHERETFDHIVGLLTTAFPAIGAAFYAIREQGDFKGVAERSRAMVNRLSGIDDALRAEAVDGVEGTGRLTALAELAAEAMVGDLSDWRFVFRSKELSLPA